MTKDAPSPEEQRLHRALCDYINQAVNSEKLRELAAAHGEWFDRWVGSRTMSDATWSDADDADLLEAIREARDGEVAIEMFVIRRAVNAAIAAEREACAMMLDEAAAEARTARDNYRVLHETAHADRHDNRASAYAAGANAIRARGTTT